MSKVDTSALTRYRPFFIAAGVGIASLASGFFLPFLTTIEIATVSFFAIYLVLEVRKTERLTADFLRRHAASADPPTLLIIAIGLAAVVLSVGSLFVLLSQPGDPGSLEVGGALLTVALGWATIHTMAAPHYAHLYWRPLDPSGQDDDKDNDDEPHGGLEFPGNDEPGGYDFLYFSFVTGMTAQTSDVEITNTRMRKLNLVHSITSYIFNTVLVATAVNVAVSLAR